MATYVGAEVGGLLGAICATFGVVFPAFAIILIVAKCYEAFKASKVVKGGMSGLKPAVVGLIGTAVISIGRTVFTSSSIVVMSIIFALSLYLALKKKSPIIIICIAALLGIVAGYLFL